MAHKSLKKLFPEYKMLNSDHLLDYFNWMKTLQSSEDKIKG